MSSSIKEVAVRAGVSISTVSNVLSGTRPVSKELSDRVFEAVRELDYSINPMASRLRSRQTKILGVVLTSLKRVFFAQVFRGIQDATQKNGYSVMIYESDDDFEREKECVQLLAGLQVDGIVLSSLADDTKPDHREYLNSLANLKNGKKRIPVVSLERSFNNGISDSIVIDNFKAGYDAAKHLINCGHKTIAHISGPQNISMCRERLAGYKRALQDSGLEVNNRLIVQSDFSPLSGYNGMRKLLESGPFTAVFSCNDQTAIGALSAAKEMKIKVPDDIAIMGFDNIYPSALVDPPISTISVPQYQIGYASGERIVNLIIEGSLGSNQSEVFGYRLVVRKSTVATAESSWDLYGW